MLAIRADANQLYFTYKKGDSVKEISLPTIPDQLSYSYTPIFQEASLLGRLSPLYQYSGGSDEVYSFSIDIHVDMLNKTEYKDITVFVDDITGMSYPSSNNGEIIYPEIYFELGEIIGFCMVESNIQWKKPIVSQHYAVVSIDFTVTMLKTLTSPKVTTIETQSNTGDTISHTEKIYTGLTDEQYRKRKEYMEKYGYDTSLVDFVVDGNDELRKSYLYDEAIRTRDYATERLKTLYGAMATADGTQQINSLLGWAEEPITRMKGKNMQFYVGGKYVSIKKLKKNVNKYMEHYKDNVNKDITYAERDRIAKELINILESIERSEGEVIKYAASK